MKSLRSLLALASFLAIATSSAFGQSVGNYAPVTRTTGITYSSIAGTGSSFSWRLASTDDNRSHFTPIGFTFYYDGQAATQFCASTNGFLDFSASTAIGGSGAYGFENTEFTSTTGTLLAVAPLYDDLNVDALGLAASVKYLTTGAPGSRVLTVEWINLQLVGATGSNLNYQVKLYEATGVIEIVYGSMTGGVGPYSFTCGLNAPTMSAVPTPAELLTQQTVDTTTFSNAPANALAVVPAGNAMLTFTPIQNATPAAPTDLTFTSVTQTGMTVGWTDNSTSETYFAVTRSTDNVIFSPVAAVTSTTTAGTGTTYSLAQTGLLPGVTYYFRITANNEASAPSTPLTGNQATSAAGEITSIATGNWSATTTWSTGAIPTIFDNVTITDGTTVTIDVAATCLNLTVGQGASGILQFEPATARTLSVGLNATIAPGAILQSAASGTQTGHAITIAGNMTNNGTLDLSTNGDTAGATLAFTGAFPATCGGTGPTTDLRALTINKGTSAAHILELNPANFTIRGAATNVAGFLTILNGTLRLSGTFLVTNRVFSSAAYSIPSTGGFWLDNPNFTVAGQNASPANNGLLRLTQGTFNVGTSSGNSMGAGTGASFIIEGGAMNVTGRLRTTAIVSYNQSGGTVSVSTVGNAASNNGSFEFASSVTSFTMSGGTIVLVQASTATSPYDYRVGALTPNITGGTLQIGSGATTTNYNFRIAGAMPNVVIDNTTNNKTATLMLATLNLAYLNTTINPGSTLNLNGLTYTQAGPTFTNNGTLNGATIGSHLHFLGAGSGAAGGTEPPVEGAESSLALPGGPLPLAVAQTYTGSGGVTAPALDGLIIDNPSGVTISAGLPANIVTLRVNLVRGLLTNSNKVTLGFGTGGVITQIGAAGLTSAGGAFDTSPGFNIGSGTYSLLYMQEGAARTTGFEVPPARSVDQMVVANTNGVTLDGGNLTIAETLNLTSGNITTGLNTLAILATGSVTRTSGHVVGNLAKNFSATGLAHTMEIGSAGAYTPVDVAFASISTAGDLTASTTDGDHPSLAASPILAGKSVNRYYTLANSGIVFPANGAQVIFNWDSTDIDAEADPASFIAGQYASPTWTFPSVGTRTPTSLQVTDLSAFSDFAFGNLPDITIDDVAVAEGNAGTTAAAFTVTLSDASTQAVTVQVATADSTAQVADLDYVAVPTTTLTFNPGDPLTQTVSVSVNGDLKYELDETYLVNLSTAANAMLADTQGLGTIENDDTAPAISITDVSVTEGDAIPKSGKMPATATFTVSLSNASQQTVTVDYATADGTATVADLDYVGIPTTTLTFVPGDPTSQDVAVTVNGDVLNEADETFFVNLSNAVNATIADNQGAGTIQNDDPLPVLTIDDVTVVEGDTGTTTAGFTVTLSPASGQTVTVDYATSDGTATVADLDYVPITLPGTLTFNPGDPLTQTVSVTVNGDVFYEADETFFLDLSGPTNATLADNQGQCTIQNDDPLGSLIRVPQDYPTIQQAINAANPLGESRIEVAAGTYPENLVIDRRLDLVGSGMGTTYVNAASPGIIVTASSVTISNLTLTGGGTDRGILVDHAGGTVNLLTVSNVEIRNFECGIWFEDSVPPLDGGSGHVIENCRIHDHLLGNPLYIGAGVNGSYTAGLVVRGTTINDNGGPGIYLRGAAGAVLANVAGLSNYFYRNAGLAVVLDQNPANVAAAYNYWGNPDPEAVIHHQVDDPPEGLVTFTNPVAATVYVDPVFQKKPFTTTFTADIKIDTHGIPHTIRQYNVVVDWDPALLDFASATAGPFLTNGAGPNGTSFLHYGTDGNRAFSEAILGTASGATGNGTLFTITFTTETTAGISALDLPLSIALRDMGNPFNDIPNATADGSVEVDGTPPANVTAFNATVGHNKIALTWVDPTDADFVTGGAVEIWRAGWDQIAGPPTQSAYPEYDDWANDEIPVIPATRVAAVADPDWSLVTTVVPGTQAYLDASFTDATRNVYYFAAFTRDDVSNYAVTVPAVTHDRATSYYLGDFTRGPGDPLFGPPYGAPGAGSVVDFNDLASLSSVFATIDGGASYNAQGDIGPSDDNSSFGIPTTDNVIDFEDLILFAINFTNVFPLAPAEPPVPADATGPVVVEVEAPPSQLPAGATWIVRVLASGSERPFQGLRVELGYDPALLELQMTTAGDLWSGNPEGFFGALAGTGRVSLDGAFLGSEAGRAGVVASLTFRMRVAGTPSVDLARLDARNARNQALPIELGQVPVAAMEPAAVAPLAFALAQNEPNPFNPSTAIRFDLASGAHVELAIFDVRGRVVRLLVDEARPAGRYTAIWDGRDTNGQAIASGMYILRLDAGSFRSERKMTLVR